MIQTNDGDVIIHKQVWEIMRKDEHYHDLAEEIEDLEDHYDAINDPARVTFEEYLKTRKNV
jgi:hypothetical protein